MSHRDAPSPSGRRRHSRPIIDESVNFPAVQATTQSSAFSRLSCIGRLAAVLIWAFWAGCLQTIFIRIPGPAKIRLPRFFWRTIARILGLQLRVIGQSAGGIRTAKDVQRGEQPIVYVANHCSWLDIIAVGGVLHTVFVAKGEVGTWPLIGTISRLGRTIFVSRNRQNTGKELHDMADRLWDGDDIVLFPEGTSSDGSRVLPFLSSFFAVAKPGRLEQAGMPKPPPVLVQPVSIVYDRLEGLPVGRSRRSVFSWYGDMDLTPHIWSFGQWRSMRATVLLHPPLNPEDFKSRKELANATYKAVRDGAAQLRQGLVPDTQG
ncbi:1-acyl-sn-glycerol-3-phosphate acyltransferase [Gluconobacter thailandicus F149-1 = NBRC 100600]|uniref:1-acyl-sn-glycerol-3-phosphate acyltransferase n=1 Tax=Gluconobacter thailandicus NBRC 3257 TaxID=1381097 RepID=A0ABQ0IYY3_GLUTH|nr:lysophospholipid acyltransferase family protein [Gluconobacter thailandicus]KXV53086.1 acyl-phosphate glycerol 3-phosphate acyltransferase [Gluconobacter thailandicus]GAC87073.1 1-acyl-sn-glycerol-3-phosphate acyltransferase [Gluconobacter thailandicus NBRC 3255]GAD27406.1 1-acyl-sn-glycerol-3-phosphate acyltransferase [Gluconobacter thailandicus NBRC 3257]GAN93710.1 1-acyl-sn-glycerol-3-phosphate acyltransferase [Gluconobacter thailandicus F149-1 = NBRC 100600]GEL87084.1 1-acyl-sn-glycerol